MKGTSKRRVTLGDLVVSAFEGAERFGGGAATVARLASRDVEARLRRAGRMDLIRALASGPDATVGVTAREVAVLRVCGRARLSGNGCAPFAAAG